MAIALFNIFRQIKFKSKVFNYISSVTLWIYVIHEGILFRTYTRPRIWGWIIEKFGSEKVVVWAMCYAFVLFWCAFVVSALYDKLLKKYIDRCADFITEIIVKCNDRITTYIMRLK